LHIQILLFRVTLVVVLYLGYHGPPVLAKKNLDTTRVPPATNSWGVMHPVPNIVLPLLPEREGPPT
jgi:hypothetical protein